MSVSRNSGTMRKLLAHFAAVVCLVGLVACSSDDVSEPEEVPSVKVLYDSALDNFQQGWLQTAAGLFEEVSFQHPYSRWASQAQLMAAFSHYSRGVYSEAIAQLDQFISLHPGHRNVDYAYYLRAMCYYNQILDVGRDQKITHQALAALSDVAVRFPETAYGQDARAKVDVSRDQIAAKSMTIGRFYQQRGECIAALGRYEKVVREYQTTAHIPEALHRTAECYVSLGLYDEARRNAAVLRHNYPRSRWYRDSYTLLRRSNLQPAQSSLQQSPSGRQH